MTIGQVDTGRVTHQINMHRGNPWKQPVRVATTANGTLASAFDNGSTIDGVTLATGDRILIKNQSDQTVNGIYVVLASGAPARAYDFDDGSEAPGGVVLVLEGTANAMTTWICTNTTEPVIGDDNITFAAFGGGADLSGINFLVGTATGLLSAEIAVGTTPGGELGGSWASPTVDSTHSGSAHTDFIAKSLLTTQDDIIVRDASAPARLAKGSDGQVLTVDPTTHHLIWATPSSGTSDGHGTMAIRYVFSTTTTDSDPGSGNARLSNATQSSAVTLRLDLTDADGVDVTAMLDSIADWLSTTKGYVRIQHRTDPTKWLFGTLSAIASPSGYRNITIANVAKSTTSPLANSDPIVVEFLPGTLAHQASHNSGGSDALKLDDLAAPDDNTDLNASTGAHGLLKKLPNNATLYLDGQGNFTDPALAGGGTSFAEAVYGSGLDGDVTIAAGTTSLTRDMYYNNLTVTGTLDTNGWRVFCKTSVGGAGTISNNPSAATAGGNGTAAAGGAAGGAGGVTNANQLGSGSQGVVGRIGGFNAVGLQGTQGQLSTQVRADTTTVDHPASTAGGNGTSAGGAGRGALTGTNALDPKVATYPICIAFRDFLGSAIPLNSLSGRANSGGSGGGGSGAGGGGSGGSGAGGGPIVLVAKSWSGSFIVQSKGSAGGNGGNGFAGGAGAAGGGAGSNGGPGGVVVAIYKDRSGWSGSIDVSGGAGGTHGNGGNGGTNGGDGATGPTGHKLEFQMG